MEIAIGVFASRDRAEGAVKELLKQRVPEQSIVFLTRSEHEATLVGKEFGTFVGSFAGGAVGWSAGVAVATLLVPGIGSVFALGIGAAAVLGLVGAGTGAAVSKAISDETASAQPTPDEKCPEDALFFREVLKEGRSLIVVRTDSQEIATVASGVLDRLGLGMQRKRASVKMKAATRQVGDITILDLSGRITLGEDTVVLRETVRDLLDKGSKKLLLNLGQVEHVDSSGVGELVRTSTTVRDQGGELRLANLSKRVHNLFQMTGLYAVFHVEKDEASAINSFGGQSASKAMA
ncbi:MAG TPA: STAS domain-containing protein [Terriglobales bacterium]|nr:STAS domain-containing protein [Terriglobales bacterium]